MTYIDYSEEVRKAKEEDRPIVLIETAGTFEGIPYPNNGTAAIDVMRAVRESGAVPAYLYIREGRLKVGMTDEEAIAFSKVSKAEKASRREIPQILAKKGDGIITLGGAMSLSGLLGVPIVLGGGLGGVHRGAEVSMDISADLEELAMDNVITVCSGAKPILDLNLTLEYLETKSVSVIGYQTDILPAYTLRDTGIKVPCRMETAEEIAEAYRIKNELGYPAGFLVCNPLDEEHAIDAGRMKKAVDGALELCKKNGVTGKPVTQYVFDAVFKELGPDNSEAQHRMILRNAALASEIAKKLK